jgi:soluble lytic murein transglycosylase-like protein
VKAGLLAFGALVWTAPLSAQSQDPLAPLPNSANGKPAVPPANQPGIVFTHTIPRTVAVPGSAIGQQPVSAIGSVPSSPPPPTVTVPKDWRGVFDAIDAGNWSAAQAGIAYLPRSILTPVARAQLYTAKGSPVVDAGSLQTLIAEAPELPQADQLALMAYKRGATAPMMVVPERQTINLGSAPVRYRTHPVQGEPAADQLRGLLDALIKANDAQGAEAQLLTFAPQLSTEARAEAGQRTAFAYYVRGLDTDARRVADTWRQGATGEWAAQSAWISGLASWRLGDCQSASGAFNQAAAYAQQRELRSGALYWAARAEQACGRPNAVAPLLKAAAQSPESFYGLVARETLGMDTKLAVDAYAGFDPPVDQLPNVQRAVELVRIGEPALAEEMLRHQAKIGLPTEHHALIQIAKKLDLPAAQLWLANNGQPGARSTSADRYPNPRWTPLTGWRVDPALAFGHVVQESSFRRAAISTAGAVGLMQVRPGSASDMARARGLAYSPAMLTEPGANLEFGQSYIEMLRGSSATAGQLPRVIASYNAGPLPVSRWASINDKGDPLLWIESIPYWETRYYVPSVLRNMWVYQGLNGEDTTTLKDVAEHRWPTFPTGMTKLTH